MPPQSMLERTKKVAMETIKLVEILPRNRVSDVLGRQILRSSTSIGANYRAACRARSRADFISKMGIVEEEADETIYWLELLGGANLVDQKQVRTLASDVDEIIKIAVASIKTARNNQNGLRAQHLCDFR